MTILMFSFFDIFIGNSVVSMLIIYIFEKMLQRLRAYLGEKNISKKTLTDQRFLI